MDPMHFSWLARSILQGKNELFGKLKLEIAQYRNYSSIFKSIWEPLKMLELKERFPFNWRWSWTGKNHVMKPYS